MDILFELAARPARRNYRSDRLFVHECRCMAAHADRAGGG